MPRQILDVRARLVASRGLPPAKRAVLELFQHPRLFDLAARAAVIAQRPMLNAERRLKVPVPSRWRWRKLPVLAERPARDELFDRTFEPFEPRNGPWVKSGARGKTVAYFIQCVTDRFAPEQALAAVRLLQACGARVTVPRSQHCCGLPHLDSGDLPGARRLAKATITALEAEEADYVVTAAASCAVSILHDYAHLLRDEPSWVSRAERLGNRTMDLLSFLERVATPAPLPQSDGPKVTYHSFCQSTNVLGIGEIGPRLLRLAGVRLEELPEATVCCGFGGATSIDYPEVGRGIVSRKLENVRATGAQVLCSDNPGCLLHLRGAAQAAGDNFLQVRHIAELLAERVAPV
ncbi:MAG: (Fe-S)-binding protein [Chloroflexi bacterium]|nr:(Fe-S)-binding protein [Chloroflexota bacterium]